jgi:hypothetical protein
VSWKAVLDDKNHPPSSFVLEKDTLLYKKTETGQAAYLAPIFRKVYLERAHRDYGHLGWPGGWSERTSPPSTGVAGRGIVVATRLYLNGDAVRVVLGEVGLSVLAPDDLTPDRVLRNDVLQVGSVGLLGLDGQGRARDEVAL